MQISKMCSILDLPCEVLTDLIFRRLDNNSLLNARAVCAHWKHYIDQSAVLCRRVTIKYSWIDDSALPNKLIYIPQWPRSIKFDGSFDRKLRLPNIEVIQIELRMIQKRARKPFAETPKPPVPRQIIDIGDRTEFHSLLLTSFPAVTELHITCEPDFYMFYMCLTEEGQELLVRLITTIEIRTPYSFIHLQYNFWTVFERLGKLRSLTLPGRGIQEAIQQGRGHEFMESFQVHLSTFPGVLKEVRLLHSRDPPEPDIDQPEPIWGEFLQLAGRNEVRVVEVWNQMEVY